MLQYEKARDDKNRTGKGRNKPRKKRGTKFFSEMKRVGGKVEVIAKNIFNARSLSPSKIDVCVCIYKGGSNK